MFINMEFIVNGASEQHYTCCTKSLENARHTEFSRLFLVTQSPNKPKTLTGRKPCNVSDQLQAALLLADL